MALSEEGLERLHTAMAARVDKGELPGLVTLVADDDDVVVVDPIGMFGFDDPRPMRRDTLFRITSLTKPIVGLAAMVLIEDGTIGLNEPIDRLLPELADRRVLVTVDGPLYETVPADRQTTVEDLLTFRMGHGLIVEPTFDPPYPIITRGHELDLRIGPPEPRTPHAPDEWIRRFGLLPLMDQPGQRWRYNTGTLVLGVLLARAAGTDLGHLLATRVFEPLGMTSTNTFIAEADADRLPRCYQGGDEWLLSPPELWTKPPVFPSGSDALISTVDDYLTFARCLLGGGSPLVSAASVGAMTTNQLTPDQMAIPDPLRGEAGWGYTMSVIAESGPISAVPSRYGWYGGYGTSWFTHPATGRIALAFTQVADFMFGGGVTEFETLAMQA